MWEYSNRQFENINLDDLAVDQAYLNITSYLPHRIWMYSLSDDCVQCPYSKFKSVNKHLLTKFSTSHWISWKFFSEDQGEYILDNETPICTLDRPNIGQAGIYNIDIWNEKCNFTVIKDAVNIYLSLLYVILIMVLGGILVYLANKLYTKYMIARLTRQSTASLDTEMDKPKITKPRLRSLDTFRGIAIALMIFVNTGGGHYQWIEHATWNGLHLADLVFPWFLWIMGVCIPMSIKSQINRNTPKMIMIKNVFYRSFKLFFIGVCLNTTGSVTNFHDLRIMGVLQRFGIAYFVVTTLHILLSKPMDFLPQSRLRRIIYDIRILFCQWLVMLAVIAVYLGLIFGLPVPNCPTGYFGPGGKHEMLSQPECIGGATGYIDRLILGEKHLYQHNHAKSVYDSRPFDPEGVFGCLTTFLQVFFGVQCGMTLVIFPEWKSRVTRWTIWSIVTGLIGGGLSAFTQDDGIIPINKNMWSLSFVLVTTSLAFILLTICYILIDVKPVWSGTPFIYAGMNAIILYVGSQIAHTMLPWNWRIGSMNTHFILLIQSVWCSTLWLVIAYILYRKKIFYSL